MTAVNRVVVTGLGAVTPLGHTVAAYWENLKAGISPGSAPITLSLSGRTDPESRRRG